MRALFVVFCIFIAYGHALANDCMAYKIRPKITISAPEWVKQVVQPLDRMDLLHGNVVATLVDNYDITADVTPLEDGYCVALKAVDATIGYSNFDVRIDISHIPGSCSYDAVLMHEDQHIRAYLSVIEDFQTELHNAVYVAADSVMPVFIPYDADRDAAVDALNAALQAHPELVLVKQKIRAAEEIRNRRIDQENTGDALKKCFE